MKQRTSGASVTACDLTLSAKLQRDWKRNKTLYALFIPVLVYYVIFQYGPMVGLIISFQNYKPSTGFFNSKWVGLQHFKDFFTDFYFQRVLMNTLRISFFTLIFTFPMPIILALLINELKSKLYSRAVQTITYIPHFISIVVVVSIMMDLTCRDGVIPNFFLSSESLLRPCSMRSSILCHCTSSPTFGRTLAGTR